MNTLIYKNYFKKIFIWLIILLLFLTQFSSYFNRKTVKANIDANTTQNIQMDIITRDKDSSGNSVFSYLTGKEIRPQADILVSGTNVNYPNGKLILKVPKTTTNGIKLTKPTFISSKEAESSTESETDTHYIMTYQFRQIKGGLIGTYDFPLRFPNEITANGDTIPVSWEMQDESGNVIRKVEKTFTAIASSTWKTDKVIFDNHNLVTNDDPWVGNPRTDGYQELRLHFTDKAVRTHTSANVDNTNKVNYYIDAEFEPQNGAETQYGIYNPKTITFIDKIPEGGTYENIDLEHWARIAGARVISKEYNETTREVRMKVELKNLQGLWGKENRKGLRAQIQISYRNQPIDAIHKNTAQIIMDEGLESEQVLNEATWSIKFRDFYYKSHTPWGHVRSGNFHLDTHREWTYTYNPDTATIVREGAEATKGLLYSTLLHGYHNGSGFNNSTGIYTALKNVLYNQLDPKLYVSSFSFSTWELTDRERHALNSTPNKLWGIKENGDRVLIAENIKASSNDIPREQWDITINDVNQEYKQLLLEWPETPLILDNDIQYLDLFMKPIPSEIEKFKNFEYTGTQRYEVYTTADYSLIHNYATIEKNSNNEFYVKSGQLPVNAVLNTTTGEITIPKEQLILNSAVTASSTRKTPTASSSARSMTRVNDTSIGTPIISFLDDFTVEVYPNLDERVTRTEVVFSHASGERTTLIAEKSETGWAITSNIPTGVSINQATGKITIQSDSVIADSDINAIHKGVNLDGERIYSRTAFIDTLNRTIIRPSTPSIHSTDTSIVIKPTLSDTVSYTFDYSPTAKSLNDYNYTSLKRNEERADNNWNKIEFPWIKARLENGNDHNIYYNSAPGANHRELFTRGLFGGSWPISDFTANFKTITLLPAGVNFVRDAGVGIKHNASNATTTPEVIENFRGTGRTAVIYSYDLTKKPTVNDAQHLNGAYYTSRFIVDVTAQAEDGDNIVEHFLVWDRDNIIKPNHNVYKDTLDLDGDGNTEDTFIRTTNRLTLILPYEVSGKKQISIDKVNWTLTAPPQDIGGDVFYRLNVLNNSIRTLPNFKIFDILPSIGDHKIIENDLGQYLPRGTQFVTPLVKSVEDVPENSNLLNKWNFYYSTTPQGADFSSSYNVEWKTKEQITDWAEVKSIKIELKSGYEFLPKEEINVILHAQIPYDKSLPIFQKAYNSFALSSLGDNFAEVNEVVSTNIKYEVDGVVFFDLDKDGVRDDNEIVLKGYNLTLVDANGVPYVDRGTGKPITATTDDNGFYHMDVYERGEYYVKVHKRYDAEEFTPELYKVDTVDERGAPIKVLKPGTKESVDGLVGNDTTQDATDVMVGNTPKFKLNPVTRIATRNAGIVVSKGDITINKVDEDNMSVSGVMFEILDIDENPVLLDENNRVVLNSNKENGKQYKSYKVTTDENGKAVFSSLEWATYKVKEISTLDKYRLDTTVHTVSVDKDNTPLVSISVTNNFKRGNISLIKKDRLNQSPLANVEFELLNENGEPVDANGKVATTGYKVRTNNLGVAIFSEVRLGNYKVRETETLASHIANPNKLYGTVTLTEDKATVQLKYTDNNEEHDTIYNDPKLATVTLKKVDAQSKEAIKGVEFALIQGENIDLSNENSYTVSYTQTTDKDGIATFKNVRYGDYKLIETKVLPEYVKIDTVIRDISVTEDGQKIEIGNIENTHIKGTVSVTKQDTETKENIAGVKFNLERVTTYDKTSVDVDKLKSQVGKENGLDGETKYSVEIVEETENTIKVKFTYTETTNDQGVAQFNGVIYGAYELSEVSGPENYTINYEKRGVIIATNGQNVEFKDETTFFNKKIKGEVVVRKLDAETKEPLANATFTLNQNGEVKYTAISDEDGFVKFANVLYGSYTLEEVAVPKGYILNAEKLGLVISEDGQVVDLGEFYNRKIKGNVQVKKLELKSTTTENENPTDVDKPNTNTEVTGEASKVIKGVEFSLTSIEKNADETPKYTYTATTGEDGYAHFDNVYYGAYILKEVTAPDGYTLNTEQRGVIVSEDGQTITLEDYYNKKIVGSVVFKKVDLETKEGLQGAKFILSKDGKQVYAGISDEEGIVKFTGVEYGVYVLSEVEAPTGYALNTEQRGVVVSEDGQVVELENFSNKKIKGEVVVQKQDVETSEVLAGVKFKLTQKGETKYEATTNEEGVAKFTNVLYGAYELEEVEAPTGYVLNTEKRGVLIIEDGQVFDLGIYYNKKIKGEVSLIKVDSRNQTLKLEGVEFALKQDGEIKYTAKSDKSGVVKFTNVLYGEYQLVETKTIAGYGLSNETRNVKITEDGQVIDLGLFKNNHIPEDEIPNIPEKPKEKGKGNLPNTGDKEETPYILTLILLTISAILYKRKYKM